MGLIENLNKITTIPMVTLKELQRYIHLIQSNEVVAQMKEDKVILELETIEGIIYISLEDDNLKYKFIPSDKFNKIIVDTVKTKESLLVKAAEEKLSELLIKTYKDIL